MLQQLKYGYDDAGNVTKISDPTTLGGTAQPDYQCFVYDGHRRLTEAWTPRTDDCSAMRPYHCQPRWRSSLLEHLHLHRLWPA